MKMERLHNLNLKISGSSVANDTERKVHIQSEAITVLINSFSDYFEHQCEKIREKQSVSNEECMKNHNLDEIACNHEMEKIQADFSFFINQQLNFKNIANHSVFLMLFAYFESIVTHVRVSLNLSPVFSISHEDIKQVICMRGNNMSKDVEEALDYLVNTVKEIRNLLTHNFNGSTLANEKRYLKQLDIAKEEHSKGIGFFMERNDHYIIEKQYLQHVKTQIDFVIEALLKSIL